MSWIVGAESSVGYVSQAVLQRLWDVLTGEYPPAEPREIPIAASLLYYCVTILVCRLVRLALSHWAPTAIQAVLCDLVTAFQCCACSLENAMIRRAYGVGAYALDLFILSMWYSQTVGKQCSGNPCASVISYVRGQSTSRRLVVRVAAQLCGGLLSFRYARAFWYLGLTKDHAQRFTKTYCVADLTVAPSVGLLIEFGATFVDTLLCLFTFTPFYVAESATKALFGVIMTLTGLHLTGMYMNPVNATNQTFGCAGINALEHLFIYWLGPLSGAASAVKLQRYLTKTFRFARNRSVSTADKGCHGCAHCRPGLFKSRTTEPVPESPTSLLKTDSIPAIASLTQVKQSDFDELGTLRMRATPSGKT